MINGGVSALRGYFFTYRRYINSRIALINGMIQVYLDQRIQIDVQFSHEVKGKSVVIQNQFFSS